MGIKVLSLFDGMSCGMLAMQKAGIEVESYDAYEIDKYAIQVSMHNFPMIKQHGDVFKADFTEYDNVDYLIGGSPCTYWSIAQKNNRETEASGLGWELFSQYVRALHEAKPKFFVYENNKSMSKEIRASIDKEFGFESICINSALVSAQNRQRLYWVGVRQPDGAYAKADIQQPEDKGILLKDILETGNDLTSNDKAWTLTASYGGAAAWNTIERSQRNMVAKPIRVGGLPRPNGELSTSQGMRIYSIDGKSVTQSAQGGGMGAKTGLYAVPCEINSVNGKVTVYEVSNGLITIKDKQYPIKLADGYYIIRKPSVRECMRLQTVPEWYNFSVISDSQAYKCLGNGWTVDVIAFLLNRLKGEEMIDTEKVNKAVCKGETSMKIKLDSNAVMPTRAHQYDAGLDLYSRETVIVPAYSGVTIDTGVHAEIPAGYAGVLFSKSGLNVKHNITSTGVIDTGYTGSIAVKLYNHGDKDYTVGQGDKISQLVLCKIDLPSLELVDSFEQTERGNGGFGSSGK